MKVIVNIPLYGAREYLEDFDEETIPNIGEMFDDKYVVVDKSVNRNVCVLDLSRTQKKDS